MRSMKTMMSLSALLACLTLFTVSVAGASNGDEIKFARYPHICNGKIAFSYHGDIWVADEDGQNPYRLTNHVARDINPRFSPDGAQIAFSSDRLGNNDLWVIPVEGGMPRQLTFHTTGDTMLYWTPDGRELLFRTSRKGAWGSPLYTVDLEGSLPEPLDIDRGAAGMISQDGEQLAFNRFSFSTARKHYKGNNNTDIWVQDLESKKIRQLTDLDTRKYREHVQDALPMWGADGLIYFVSERSGIFNIWKIAPNGRRLRQVTEHQKDGVQNPSISPDGQTIIYECEFELWKLSVPDGEPEKISVSLGFEPKDNLVEYLKVSSQADGFSPSPKGDYVAVDRRGEIFVVPADPKVGEKKRITDSPWRDRYQEYSPDGEYLAYISDESLEEELWLYHLKTNGRHKISNHQSLKTQLRWSRDSNQLLYQAANSLFLYDIVAGRTTELAHNDARGFRLSDWSKDGQWLLYTRSHDDYNQDLYLFEIESKTEYNISQNPFRESSGKFSADEKQVVFISNRTGSNQLYAVPLTKVAEDKDDPVLREQKQAKKKEKEQEEKKDDEDKNKEETQEQDEEQETGGIDFDLDGIDRRAVQLNQKAQSVSGILLVAKKDGKIHFTGSDDKGAGLFSIDLDGENEKKVTDGSFRGAKVSSDGKSLFFREGSALNKMPLTSGAKKKIEFEFTIEIDKQRDWEQVFEEAWRSMKYRFYDENMHGFDWAAIKAYYKPLLAYAGEFSDIRDLANEMIGELNASHVGIRGGPGREQPTTYQTRYLGLEMEEDSGYYRVSHIYWNGPADKEWLDIKVGDYVMTIEGVKVRAGDNYWKILNHCLNDYVTLEVKDSPLSEELRQFRIKTASSLRSIKYEEWVEKNRKYVKELTDDKIAYVHIQGMNQPSLARFRNEVNRYYNHQGIIVDIRYNGGGNTDQEILEILSRRAYEYWNNRWSSREMGRRPRQAIEGPKVILINWRSASDSEVTPQGFRDLELGRIVGTPTAGAVIATGSYRLMNGASIRTPGSLVTTYDPTKPNNYGINLENYGVPPDVWVENSPEDELQGFDRELEAAAKEALKMLKEKRWRYDR